jgi:hypothetical protein
LTHLADLCDADTRCVRRFPATAGDLQRAIDRLQAAPVRVRTVNDTVLMDGAALLRTVRWRLSSAQAGSLPATIATIANGKGAIPILTSLASQQEPSQTYCGGYLPLCPADQSFSQGAYYSVLCRDEASFADVKALSRLAAGDPSWSADYVDSPYLDVCRAWDVQPGDHVIADPVTSNLPVLIENGTLSPFVDPAVIAAGVGGLTDVSIAVSPSNGDGGYFDWPHCPDVRLSFFDHPQEPVDASCYQDGRLLFDMSPEGSS